MNKAETHWLEPLEKMSARAIEFAYRLGALQNDPPMNFCHPTDGWLPAEPSLLLEYLYPLTSYYPISKRNNSMERDVASEWRAELNRVYAMRLRVAQRLRRAARRKNEKEATRLHNRLIKMSKPCAEWRAYPAADEKVTPRPLRNSYEETRIWRVVHSCFESDSPRNLLLEILDRFSDRDKENSTSSLAKYFMTISRAFEQMPDHLQTFERIKHALLLYRNSLRWSMTPGKPRHTMGQIKDMVAPHSTITVEVFRNMVNALSVPYLHGKPGPSPKARKRKAT